MVACIYIYHPMEQDWQLPFQSEEQEDSQERLDGSKTKSQQGKRPTLKLHTASENSYGFTWVPVLPHTTYIGLSALALSPFLLFSWTLEIPASWQLHWSIVVIFVKWPFKASFQGLLPCNSTPSFTFLEPPELLHCVSALWAPYGQCIQVHRIAQYPVWFPVITIIVV